MVVLRFRRARFAGELASAVSLNREAVSNEDEDNKCSINIIVQSGTVPKFPRNNFDRNFVEIYF